MDVRQATEFAEKILGLHTCEGSDPVREAQELLAFSLDTDRSALLREPDRVLNGREESRLSEALSRRMEHEPLARIFGSARFLGRDFSVDRYTLIPRPATEILVERAIEAVRNEDDLTAVDVGTGSGCVAVSLALVLPETRVIATDASPEALEAARRNALAHHVADRIEFLQGDLLSPLPPLSPLSPLLVLANLPYIPTDRIYYLSPCVTIGDPIAALDGGPDGLSLYRRLLDQLSGSVGHGRLLLFFELLPGQLDTMKEEITGKFPAAKISEIWPGTDAEPIGLAADIPDRG